MNAGWRLCCVLGMLVAFALSSRAEAEIATPVENAAPISPFSLTDDTGAIFDNARLDGRWSLVAIGFTNCPDVCPFTLSNLEAVYTQLGMLTTPEKLPQVIFVAVDPERDAAILGDYVKFFHPDFVGVTGAKDQIDILVEGIDAYYERRQAGANGYYAVDHTTFVAILDETGRLRAKFHLPLDPKGAATYLIAMQRGEAAAE